MPSNYSRCVYSDETGRQCETFFKYEDGGSLLCAMHFGSCSPQLASMNENKGSYLEFVNNERAQCVNMSFDELDEHIAKIERIIELERTKLLAARATKTEKMDNLSEDERKIRRATKIIIDENGDVVEVKRGRKPNVLGTEQPKRTSMKQDPIKHMMEKFNMTESQAKEMLS